MLAMLYRMLISMVCFLKVTASNMSVKITLLSTQIMKTIKLTQATAGKKDIPTNNIAVDALYRTLK